MDERSIVVGVDGSPQSRAAIQWAADEAARRGSVLHLVHAARPLMVGGPYSTKRFPPFDETARTGEQLLNAERGFAQTIAPGLTVTAEFRVTSPAQTLIEASEGAELVVVGSRGRSAAVSLALGSVSLHVASHAASPVAVVRGVGERPPSGGPVVVGVDGSAPSLTAVGFAFDEAAIRGAPVLAVHAWDDFSARMSGRGRDYFHDMTEQQLRELQQALSRWRGKYPDVEVRTQAPGGHPVPALLAASRRAQLVVVGSRGRGEFLGMLLGSVGAALIREADCPVIISR